MTSAAKEIVGICLWECQKHLVPGRSWKFVFLQLGRLHLHTIYHPQLTMPDSFFRLSGLRQGIGCSATMQEILLLHDSVPPDPDANSRMVNSLIFSAMMWCCLRGIMSGSFMCCPETVWASTFQNMSRIALTSSPRCVLEDMETTIPKTWPTIQVLHSATHSLSYFWSSSVASRTLLPFLRGLGKCQEASTFVARPSKIYVGPVITQRWGADPVRSPQKLKFWMSKCEEETYTFNL